MGSRELMITEMVLQCVLADKQPTEIAALLSCLVFQQRTRAKPKLTKKLEEVNHSSISPPLSYHPLDAGLPNLSCCAGNFVNIDTGSLCKQREVQYTKCLMHKCVRVCVYTHAHIHVCIYIYIYVCVYIHTYIHTHTSVCIYSCHCLHYKYNDNSMKNI
jgi:hypothetical protein